MRKDILAAALSAIVPGAGQFYNRQWVKGGVFLLAVMILSWLIRRRMLFEGSSTGMAVLVALVLMGLAVWSVADAYQGAKRTT
jgi:hypothetical protein